MVTQKAGQSSGKIVSSGTITRFSYLRGEFHGFIYGENPRSKALLIKCWKAQEEFGREAVLLFRSNSVGAKVGDKISFDVEELRRKVNGVPEPLAVNVRIRSAVPVFIKPKVPFTDTSGFLTVTPLSFTHAQFTGFIYQKISTTRTLLIACSRAHDEFGAEAVIPLWANAVRAEVGDKISFDVEDLVQEGEGKPRPMAINVLIRSRGYTEEEPEVPAPTDVCTQILYYFSDRNLRTDKFFQDTIAASEGGWISTDILLRFPRVKQLAASAQSVVECLQDAPGVEVRDTPGQEAVRRTSPPPPLEGTVAAVLAKSTLVIPAVAKHKYSMEDMMRWGDGPQDRELELSEPEVQELEGPQAHEAQHRDRARRGAITQKHEREARKDNKGNKRPAQPTANIYSAALEAIAEKPVSKRKPPRKGKKASKESKDATGDNVGEEGLAATGTARGPKEAQNQKPVTGKAAEVRKRPQRRQTSSSTAVKKEQATTATETPMATKEAQNQKPATEKAAELPKKKVARRPKRQQGSQGGKAEKEEATTAAETAPRKKKSSNRSAGNAKEKQRKSQEKKEGDN